MAARQQRRFSRLLLEDCSAAGGAGFRAAATVVLPAAGRRGSGR